MITKDQTVEEMAVNEYFLSHARNDLVFMKKMFELYPCKQYQLAIMDLESFIENLESIDLDGKQIPLKVITAEESQVQDEFEFPADDEVELVYSDSHETSSGHTVNTETLSNL